MFVQSYHSKTVITASLLWALCTLAQAEAQVSKEVVIGITPTCPYGIAACAVGAREGLMKLEGVHLVADIPDKYNSTFEVRLKEAKLPDVDGWQRQFEAVVGKAFGFRGIEVTVTGSLVNQNDVLMLQAAGLQQPIILAPLVNKLQWNFRKGAARQPEPAEAQAYEQLVEESRKASKVPLKVEIIGPLRYTKQNPLVEVRESYLSRDL